MQVEGEDYFESYAPVVQWSTTRLLIIMSILHNLHTCQVDYVNAFAQADLNEDVYIEMPQGYKSPDRTDTVLKLNKSLYGLVQAPVKFFELLCDNHETWVRAGVQHRPLSLHPCKDDLSLLRQRLPVV